MFALIKAIITKNTSLPQQWEYIFNVLRETIVVVQTLVSHKECPFYDRLFLLSTRPKQLYNAEIKI